MMKALWINDKIASIVEKEDLSLEVLQEFVGGLIEPFYTNDVLGYTAYCNEEGKINGKCEPSLALVFTDHIFDVVYGDVIFTGLNSEGETVSLNQAMVMDIFHRFKSLSVVVNKGVESDITAERINAFIFD